MKMKKGSVILDVAIDNGKAVETSELTTQEDPYIIKNGVIHAGLPNLTSKMPRTTTKAISNFFLTFWKNFPLRLFMPMILVRFVWLPSFGPLITKSLLFIRLM